FQDGSGSVWACAWANSSRHKNMASILPSVTVLCIGTLLSDFCCVVGGLVMRLDEDDCAAPEDREGRAPLVGRRLPDIAFVHAASRSHGAVWPSCRCYFRTGARFGLTK